jgi:hypothetical protein
MAHSATWRSVRTNVDLARTVDPRISGKVSAAIDPRAVAITQAAGEMGTASISGREIPAGLRFGGPRASIPMSPLGSTLGDVRT